MWNDSMELTLKSFSRYVVEILLVNELVFRKKSSKWPEVTWSVRDDDDDGDDVMMMTMMMMIATYFFCRWITKANHVAGIKELLLFCCR